MIITIDGPVATGKSSVAKKLAESLGFIFFDTGAMYRAITYSILKHHVNIRDLAELIAALDHFQFKIKVIHGQKHYFIESEDITDIIRTQEVTAAVSEVSSLAPVREKLVTIQHGHAQGVNAVFEGRDMGTTVFPNADLKIFLTGRIEIRGKRRYTELVAKNPELTKILTLERCIEDVQQRDSYDSTREISPLRQAQDAFVIDTSDISVEDVVFKILECKDTAKTRKRTDS
jgi:CMP/dCMP kinase